MAHAFILKHILECAFALIDVRFTENIPPSLHFFLTGATLNLSFNWIFIVFFVFGIGYLWLKKPALPIGSGDKATWIKYKSNSSAWVKRAGIYTLLCVAGIVLNLLRMAVGF